MGCGSSNEEKHEEHQYHEGEIVYIHGQPTFTGDEVVKGFEKDNGLLFRIVNNETQEWAYYNDTTQYEMHITVTFNEDCEIRALGKTVLEQQENGDWTATVVVYPTETEMFIEGRVNGFKAKMDALPLSEEYRNRNNAAQEEPQPEGEQGEQEAAAE